MGTSSGTEYVIVCTLQFLERHACTIEQRRKNSKSLFNVNDFFQAPTIQIYKDVRENFKAAPNLFRELPPASIYNDRFGQEWCEKSSKM